MQLDADDQPTPFDSVVAEIRAAGFHNHRLERHSDLVSDGIFKDLVTQCPQIATDLESGAVARWNSPPAPGARGRKLDLAIGEPDKRGNWKSKGARICVENKSVITAHRNKTNRLDDLDEVLRGIHRVKPEAVIIATVLVGTAERVLNVPDQVKKRYWTTEEKKEFFRRKVLPRLSSGDESLLDEYDYAVSENRPTDPATSVEAFKSLPTRTPGRTDLLGYDYVLIVPVFIDNVNPPYVARDNAFGIDVDGEYERMLETICRAYEARWHLG